MHSVFRAVFPCPQPAAGRFWEWTWIRANRRRGFVPWGGLRSLLGRHRDARFFGDGPEGIVNRAPVRSRVFDWLCGNHDASRAPPDDALRLDDGPIRIVD